MTSQGIMARIVRHRDLASSSFACIHACWPGSDQRGSFAIIGGGVLEHREAHVHVRIPHGFSIGAAGQPRHRRNGLGSPVAADAHSVLEERLRASRQGGNAMRLPCDMVNVPVTLPDEAVPSTAGKAALCRAVATDDEAPPVRI